MPCHRHDLTERRRHRTAWVADVGSCAAIEGTVRNDRETVGGLHWTGYAAESPNCATVLPLSQFTCVLDELQDLVRRDVAKYAGNGAYHPFPDRFREELGACERLLHHGAGEGIVPHRADVDTILADWRSRLVSDKDDAGPGKRCRLR